MNIIYIDHYAGSNSMGMEFRPYYFAREWQKMGHNVRIIAANFSHLRKVNPNVKEDFEIQYIEGVEFQWIKTRDYEGNGLSRAITMLQFCSKLWLNAKSLAREFEPDVIISSSTYPLDTYSAQRIKKYAKRAVLVHEIHDMWPAVPIELYGMSKIHPFVIAMQAGENSFCRHSDKVVSILPCAEEYLLAHGLKKGKFYYISNGVVEEEWNEAEELPQLHQLIINRVKVEGRLLIGFFGSITPMYNLDIMLEALTHIDSSKVFFMIVGDGHYKEELEALARRLNLDKSMYEFCPPIDKKSIPNLIKQLDASYVAAVKDKMFRFGIGMNKLFDSMMGGVPILYAVDAPNNMVLEYNCGINVTAGSKEDLIKGIENLLCMSDDDRKELGKNGHNAIVRNHTYKALAQEFIEVINAER